MKIDIVSDTVCPWCFIGKRKLEAALAARPDLEVEVTWHPFQLHPDMPEGGADRKEFTARKFGSAERAKELYENIKIAGQAVDIPFNFSKIERTPNTLDSHRLIRWAHSAGCQDALVEILFRRFFVDGEDIGDHTVLIAAAEEAGMDKTLVTDLLEKGADRDLVSEEDMRARQMGVSGVPFFILNDKYAVSGAQDPAAFLAAFDKIAEHEANEAENPE
ncbi:DsbA family oxidoreductase [Sneathiella sp. CAU 1612]|jgi:predicted DsbA family dithiol-disulfide isomerase|uniref:DsbA family oxidoreductase n=1 Tax=Sneathiella sedimenti TaxID=2816034 RepID=A0ABS3F941_9PROT|nr:DsbA family oxidoreductase [Sneathiella sedimenti]MBO0334899.1 DsbA family oxidoreductase [Sneathiella sedimenti]